MWTPVYGFEENYQINEQGQVKSLASNKILSAHYDNKGYLLVGLCKDGRRTTKSIHRLLMETFCPCENMMELTVNHINHIKDDNRLENLEWMTNADNVREAHQAGLPHKYVGGNNKKAVQCVETGEIFESAAAAARAVNIKSRGKIGAAIQNPNKTCGGYHWKRPE